MALSPFRLKLLSIDPLMTKNIRRVYHVQFGALEDGAATYVDQYKLRAMHIGVGGICLAGTAAAAFVTVSESHAFICCVRFQNTAKGRQGCTESHNFDFCKQPTLDCYIAIRGLISWRYYPLIPTPPCCSEQERAFMKDLAALWRGTLQAKER